MTNKLKSRCYLKLAEWAKAEDAENGKIEKIVNFISMSTNCDPDYYKAWQAFGLTNYEMVCKLEESAKEKSEMINVNCLSAINGFVKAIALGGNDLKKTLQNLLRLLKLWFTYGDNPKYIEAIKQSFATIEVTSWLSVLPQILARIDINNKVIRGMMFELLDKIGKAEPQSLLYPIYMMQRSGIEERRKCAEELAKMMHSHSHNLMSQAENACHELIRVAILLCNNIYLITFYHSFLQNVKFNYTFSISGAMD